MEERRNNGGEVMQEKSWTRDHVGARQNILRRCRGPNGTKTNAVGPRQNILRKCQGPNSTKTNSVGPGTRASAVGPRRNIVRKCRGQNGTNKNILWDLALEQVPWDPGEIF